jgi:2-polyprenyl-3-methyl-5-hydroxy-6-metoxy-1,4-benzoquinol methylase
VGGEKMNLNNFERRQQVIQNRDFSRGDGYSKDFLRFNRYFHYIKKYGKMDLNSWVLDVGCGPGPLEVYLKKYGFQNVYAVDYAEEGLKIARNNTPEYEYFLYDVKEIDVLFTEKKFDLVFCCQVLEHIPDYRKVLQNMFDLLNKAGLMILSTPYDRCKMNEWHCNTFTPDSWKGIFKSMFDLEPLVTERFAENDFQLLTILEKGE